MCADRGGGAVCVCARSCLPHAMRRFPPVKSQLGRGACGHSVACPCIIPEHALPACEQAPLSRETKVDKKSSRLRVPPDSPQDFTALMCACMLDEEQIAFSMASLLLAYQADPSRFDSEV
jgi:hypothetical protein